MARANRWDVLPGPNPEPEGGWDEEALAQAEKVEARQRDLISARTAAVPEGYHLDRGEDESDDEFDVNEAAWQNGIVKRQWAETCCVRVRHVDVNTLFGKGKVIELALYVARNPCDYVFINTQLTPTQLRNLGTVFSNAAQAADTKERRDERRMQKGTRSCYVEIVDRTKLVLDIFHTRASSPQAKLQVGLARLEYMKTRLILGSKSRLKQAFRILEEEVGPFKEVSGMKDDVVINYEYEAKPFEAERIMIRDWEKRLKRMLAKEKKTQENHRKGRENVPTIGLVGYTNSGKTSLMNKLTGADLREKDLLFQTLDTTLRQVKLPQGEHAVIADSIGFIQDLPHQLFVAFEATLAELLSCDVLLHVRDIAHPQSEMQRQTVISTLRSAGVSEEKLEASVIEVWNKIDLLSPDDLQAMGKSMPAGVVPVCAADGAGVEALLNVLQTVINSQLSLRRRSVSFPEASMSTCLKLLHQIGTVDHESMAFHERGDVTLNVVLSEPAWGRWQSQLRRMSAP